MENIISFNSVKDCICEFSSHSQALSSPQNSFPHFVLTFKSLESLPNMFIVQGEMIDRIEYHVEHAVDYVQTATQVLRKHLDNHSISFSVQSVLF